MIKHHPSDETLFRFANGSLEPGPRIIVAVHVGGCAICASRISEFEAVGGSLMYNIEPDDMEPSALDHVMAKIEIDEAGRDRLAVRPRLPRADLGIHLPQVLDDCGIGPWRWIGPGVRWSRVTLPDDDHANVMLLKVTAGRKLREVLIAFWLEAWLSEDEILSRYLSNVYFGDNVYGLTAAAKHYFGRAPDSLPVDGVVAKEFKAGAPCQTVAIAEVPADAMILDAGSASVDKINEWIDRAATLVWNGPLGAFEIEPFDRATVAVARHAAARTRDGRLTSVAGGGDTVSALNHAGVADDFTYVSTAGGAFLEWMEGKPLPGVEVLKKQGEG